MPKSLNFFSKIIKENIILSYPQKPNQLVRNMRGQIRFLSHSKIKNFLKKHLNDEAQTYSQLFCKLLPPNPKSPLIHDPQDRNQYTVPKYSPLALFYMYASIEAQHELTDLLLTLAPRDMVDSLAFYTGLSLHNGDMVLRYAAIEDKHKLARCLKSLNPKQIKYILAKSADSAYDEGVEFAINPVLYSLPLDSFCPLEEEETVINYFDALGQLETKDLLILLGIDNDGRYFAEAKRLFSLPLSEKVALALLTLLDKLDTASLSTVFSDTHFFKNSNEGNLLHLIFQKYSLPVIEKTLSLLLRLNDIEVKALLTALRRSESKSVSCLQVVFDRRDNPAIAMRLMHALKKSSVLFNLLVDTSKGESPEQLAIKYNDLNAITYLLEQPEFTSSILLTSAALLNETITALYQAKPIRDAIMSPVEDKVWTTDCVPLIQKYPAIISTRWSQQKTLLHLAARRGNAAAVISLLEQGASPNLCDEHGITPFHEAMESEDQPTILAFVTHGATNLFLPSHQGFLGLHQVMRFSDFPVLKATMSALRTNMPNEDVLGSYAVVFGRSPSMTRRISPFYEVLSHELTNLSMTEFLQAYCEDTQDVVGAFLIESAQLLAQTNHAGLLSSSKLFIRRQLLSLCGDVPTQTKETARLDLMLFLLAMPVAKMVAFLKSCQLTQKQQVQLELILCDILVKPIVFSSLSVEEERCLFSLFTENSDSLNSIITVHLHQSDLTKIPCGLLSDFANMFSASELLKHSKTRPIPSIILLALEKIGKQDPIDQENVDYLTGELQKILAQFNDKESVLSLVELRQLLNLTTHVQTKGIITNYLSQQPEEAPIRQKITDLLVTFKKTDVFMRGSLLHDAFLSSVQQQVSQADFHSWTALYQLLPKQLAADPSIKTDLLTAVIDPLLDQLLTSQPLTENSSSLLSLKMLILSHNSTLESLNEVTALLTEHPHELQTEAIMFFIESYHDALTTTDRTHAFMRTLQAILQPASLTHKTLVINTLTPTLLQSLLEHALSGLNSDNQAHSQTCHFLLLTFCQHQVSLQPALQSIIKERLGREDLSFLGDEQLSRIAESVLSEKSHLRLDGLTRDGVWIQRLLCSPRFIAASTTAVIKQLVERYRAVSLILKQEERESLNQWLSQKMPYAEQQNDQLKQIHQAMLANPEKKSYFLAKRERLLTMMVDDSIRALFNQLEGDCLDLQWDDLPENVQLADRALNTFYTYHCQHISPMRSDRLFRLADFLYSQTVLGQGDLAVSQNMLLRWIEKHLPHRTFQQNELMRKRDVGLYNEARKKIGYLDDSYYALTLIDGVPDLLINAPNTYPAMPLFNKGHQRIGTLTASSQLEAENLFRQDTVAIMVAKMPIEDLSASPAGLNLLMSDILLEHSLGTAYDCEEAAQGTKKRKWLEEEITSRLAHTDKPISDKTLFTCLKYHSVDNLFLLLATMNNSDNAYALFDALLLDADTRKHLFSPTYQEQVAAFLKRHKSEKILSDYLVYHDKPWFNEGLQYFADFANKTNQPDLLSEALVITNQKTAADDAGMQEYDALMQKLIGTEANCKLMLQFINDDETKTVQDLNTESAANISQFFDKCAISYAIKEQNKLPYFKASAQQRFLMQVLHHQQAELFPTEERRLSKREAWQDEDLLALTEFTLRHRHYQTPNDKEASIANKLITELAFRTANFGQVGLFYQADAEINTDIVMRPLHKGRMGELAALFYIPEAIQTAITKAYHTIKGWFDSSHQQTQEITQLLKESQAIIDWKKLAQTTWDAYGSDHMPLICTYLINYAGPADVLKKLITDLLSVNNPAINRAIGGLMSQLPHRDVSAVIFQSLKENPTSLDETLLCHLSSYHYKQDASNKPQDDPTKSILSLIKHFGQQKMYHLVQQCCVLVKPLVSKDKELRARVEKIQQEAITESELLAYKDCWYFKLIRFFKRAWNYDNKPSSVVKFCDDKSSYEHSEKTVEKIETNVLGGDSVSKQLKVSDGVKKLRIMHKVMLEKQKKQDGNAPLAGYARLFKPEAAKFEVGCQALKLALI